MWIVQLTLRRPLAFIVLVLLILLAALFALMRTPMDISLEVDTPVASIIQNYNDLPAKEMADRVVLVTECSLTITANDIEYIESRLLGGASIIRVFFQLNANIQTVPAQITADIQTQVRRLPPGTISPLVVKYSTSGILVLQLGLSSSMLSEQEFNDAALNLLRPHLIMVSGTVVPFPCDGKNRQITVDLDTQKLLVQGLTPVGIVNAMDVQNPVLPAGTQEIDATEYGITLDGTPDSTAVSNVIPVKTSDGAILYLDNVVSVRDGSPSQTNMVRRDGQRGMLLPILKNGSAPTLKIVSSIYKPLPTAAVALS